MQQNRKKFDFYPTPFSVITLVLRHLDWSGEVWEPCAGDGRFVQALASQFDGVHASDVQTGDDFFAFDRALADTIVTNPPFLRIRDFADHAFEIGVQRMALVCPERLWACGVGSKQFQRHRPSRFANMSFREDYLGRGGSPDRMLAVSIWDRPHSASCIYDIWDRP